MSSEQSMIDDLLAQSLAEAQGQVNGIQSQVSAAVGLTAGEQGGIDMLGDVDLDVTIELGRTEMLVEDVLRLASGSVVELNKLAGDPVDVYVNSRLIARGEVLVLNDNFCIRISEILADVRDAEVVADTLESAEDAEPDASATT